MHTCAYLHIMKQKANEKKKPFNLMLTPSSKVKAEKKAAKKKKTLSQVIDDFLYDYNAE